jgi:hypothetical protein
VPKSFGGQAPNIENFRRLRRETAENFQHVTASPGGCRNQNFVRRVTCHMVCRTELNGTVYAITRQIVSGMISLQESEPFDIKLPKPSKNE